MLLLVCMKAALGDADQDQVLCKHLGRASPGCQLKSLTLQGMFPGQIWLLGQIYAGALWQHKTPFEAMRDWAMSKTREKAPKSQYALFVQDKDVAQGSSIAGHVFAMFPQMGSQIKILLFRCTKQFQYPSFHWVMEIQIRPWMKSTSFIPYTLNPLGRLLAACPKNT